MQLETIIRPSKNTLVRLVCDDSSFFFFFFYPSFSSPCYDKVSSRSCIVLPGENVIVHFSSWRLVLFFIFFFPLLSFFFFLLLLFPILLRFPRYHGLPLHEGQIARARKPVQGEFLNGVSREPSSTGTLFLLPLDLTTFERAIKYKHAISFAPESSLVNRDFNDDF